MMAKGVPSFPETKTSSGTTVEFARVASSTDHLPPGNDGRVSRPFTSFLVSFNICTVFLPHPHHYDGRFRLRLRSNWMFLEYDYGVDVFSPSTS